MTKVQRVTSHLFYSTLLLLSLTTFIARAADEYEVGETYKVSITDLKPTQFAAGFKEIEYQVEKIGKKDNDGELSEYKKEKVGAAVIGPKGKLYLVDGHHFALALQNYGSKTTWVEIIDDYSDSSLSVAQFWAKMKRKKQVYLKDENGESRTPLKLPKTIASLKDDPYRSLAWMVRKSGGYDADDDISFLEFIWADYFRNTLKLPKDPSQAQWEKALKSAMKLASSDEASHLPGWHGDKGDCSKILDWIGRH